MKNDNNYNKISRVCVCVFDNSNDRKRKQEAKTYFLENNFSIDKAVANERYLVVLTLNRFS